MRSQFLAVAVLFSLAGYAGQMAAGSQYKVRAYNVADLVVNGPDENSPLQQYGKLLKMSAIAAELNGTAEITQDTQPTVSDNLSELAETLKMLTAKTSWKNGETIVPHRLTRSLLIRQTVEVHEEIAALLELLRAANRLRIEVTISSIHPPAQSTATVQQASAESDDSDPSGQPTSAESLREWLSSQPQTLTPAQTDMLTKGLADHGGTLHRMFRRRIRNGHFGEDMRYGVSVTAMADGDHSGSTILVTHGSSELFVTTTLNLPDGHSSIIQVTSNYDVECLWFLVTARLVGKEVNAEQ